MVDNLPPDGVGVAQSSEVALYEFTESLMGRDLRRELQAHIDTVREIDRQIEEETLNSHEMFALMEERRREIEQLFGAGTLANMQTRAQEERARFEADFGQ
ncbi:MAG TPA: hypothetical protein PKD20_05285 [Candidatus Saccharibacteria bacterium]|jgi:ABC-type phosphate transport system auxiliary subunit|nr:hypothetical protein [Candidatus Saccharibacteria bacterium]HMT56255.1 hypothetical protein [Candidatus Saccharibacteria bacterium]